MNITSAIISGSKILRNKFFSDDLYYKYYSSDYNFMKKVKLVKNPRQRFITFKIK